MLKVEIEYPGNSTRSILVEKIESEVLRLLSNKNITLKIVKNNQRDKGFNILKDKKKIDQSLKKTKMCTLGNNCHRGSNCRFAHNKSELVQSNCVFGLSCKFVKNEKDAFVNISKTKICRHKHPGENNEAFMTRTQPIDNNGRVKRVNI